MIVNRVLLQRMIEQGHPLANLGGRCTGRSTALALRLLADAIDNPGQKITARDHDTGGKYPGPTHQQNTHLLRMAADMANTLGLEKMTFSASYLTVVSNFAEELS